MMLAVKPFGLSLRLVLVKPIESKESFDGVMLVLRMEARHVCVGPTE